MSRALFRKPSSIFVLLIAAWALPLGCGPRGPVRHAVTGQVTLDGAPLPEGHIMFIAQERTAASGHGTIKDGTIHVPAAQGPAAGRYRVEIVAWRDKGTGEVNMYNECVKEQFIPARFNDASELTAQIRPSGDNSFLFEISTR